MAQLCVCRDACDASGHLQMLALKILDLWHLSLPEALQAASYQQEAGVLKLDNKRAQEDTQRLQEHIWTTGGPSEAEQACRVGPSSQWCHLRGSSRCEPYGHHLSHHRTVEVCT